MEIRSELTCDKNSPLASGFSKFRKKEKLINIKEKQKQFKAMTNETKIMLSNDMKRPTFSHLTNGVWRLKENHNNSRMNG
jgi:phage antirepressor YoqD-like protein